MVPRETLVPDWGREFLFLPQDGEEVARRRAKQKEPSLVLPRCEMLKGVRQVTNESLTVGVIVAMAHEFNATKQVLLPAAEVRTLEYSQWAFGDLAGVSLALVQSGIGTTNAAIGACELIARYHPNYLLNLGTSALIADPERRLQVGDVLAARLHRQWDLDLGGPVTSEWTDKRSLVDVLQVNSLQPDAGLWRALGDCRQPYASAILFTGNSFFCTPEQRRLLPAEADPVGVDMESFAVAQVAARKGVPFLCLRGITDTGSEDANFDFYANVRVASRNAAELARQLLQQLSTPTNQSGGDQP